METTAVLNINPTRDEKVLALYEESLKLRDYAEARVVDSLESTKDATNDLSMIAGLKKALEEKRKEYVTPLQSHVKEINTTFKMLVTPIEVANSTTRDKVLAYQKILADQKAEEERINAMRLEAATAEMELKGELTEPLALVEVSEGAPRRIHTPLATLGQRSIRKWELEDMSLVPEEYKTLDSARITSVVKAGIPSIPGIRIYEEPIVTIHTRRGNDGFQ